MKLKKYRSFYLIPKTAFFLAAMLVITSCSSGPSIEKQKEDFYQKYSCPNISPKFAYKWDHFDKKILLQSKENLKNLTLPKNKDGTYNAIVEIPSGCLDKWETNKYGHLFWDKNENDSERFVSYLPYPANYGMIPNTLMDKKLGGDGDPLDVIILGPPLARGSVVKVRVLGTLLLRDNGENDDKLIAVVNDNSPNNPFFSVKNVYDLKKRGIINIITTWFENYKGPGKIKTIGLMGMQRTFELIDKSIDQAKRY